MFATQSNVDFQESDGTYYVTGPEWRDLLSYAISTVLVIGIVQIVASTSQSEGMICLAAGLLTIGQGFFHMYQKERHKSFENSRAKMKFDAEYEVETEDTERMKDD